MKIENLTIGSDPEWFLEDKNGEIVSCVGMCIGTKENPEPISNDGHFIQIDGIAFEGNIPPSRTKEELKSNINFLKDYITRVYAEPNGLKISKKVSDMINPKYLTGSARVLGCSASFNAWTRDVNPSPDAESNRRSVGGHIFYGYDNSDTNISETIIRVSDLFLGVPSLLLDEDTGRRELYGKAGEFRFTNFGVEYRVLSNFWTQSDELIEWVFNQTNEVVNFINSGKTINDETGELIVNCINKQDKDLAKKLIEQYNLICVEL